MSAWFRLSPADGSPLPQDDEFADWGTAWPAPRGSAIGFPEPHSPAWDLMMLGQYAHEMAHAGMTGRLSKDGALMSLAYKAHMGYDWLPPCRRDHVDSELARRLTKAAKKKMGRKRLRRLLRETVAALK